MPEAITDHLALSLIQQRVLHKRTIGENEPGAVLRDFASLLNFVGAREIVVSGKNQLLPMLLLTELNSRLSRTNQVSLKRPQQKSYPYINGLYLLLRASGLSLVESRGNKQLLLLDEDVLQWDENPIGVTSLSISLRACPSSRSPKREFTFRAS